MKRVLAVNDDNEILLDVQVRDEDVNDLADYIEASDHLAYITNDLVATAEAVVREGAGR